MSSYLHSYLSTSFNKHARLAYLASQGLFILSTDKDLGTGKIVRGWSQAKIGGVPLILVSSTTIVRKQ